MATLLACAGGLLRGPWIAGAPRSLTIYAQQHDRGVGKIFRAGVSGLIEERRKSMEEEGSLGELGSFHLSAGCALHDLQHNALRWPESV
eukprot:5138882-Amphidinium_carterae.1